VEGQDKLAKLHCRKIESSIQDPDRMRRIHFRSKVVRMLHSGMFEMSNTRSPEIQNELCSSNLEDKRGPLDQGCWSHSRPRQQKAIVADHVRSPCQPSTSARTHGTVREQQVSS
jgi:hypothetical protein